MLAASTVLVTQPLLEGGKNALRYYRSVRDFAWDSGELCEVKLGRRHDTRPHALYPRVVFCPIESVSEQ